MDIEDREEINNRIHYIVYTGRKNSIRKTKKELRKQVDNYCNWSDEDLTLIKNLHFISNIEIKSLRVLKYSNRKLSIKEIEIRELEKQLIDDVKDLPTSKKTIVKF